MEHGVYSDMLVECCWWFHLLPGYDSPNKPQILFDWSWILSKQKQKQKL